MVDGALLLTAIYVSLFLYVKAYPRQAFAEFSRVYWSSIWWRRGELNTYPKPLLYIDIKFIQLDDTITDTIK